MDPDVEEATEERVADPEVQDATNPSGSGVEPSSRLLGFKPSVLALLAVGAAVTVGQSAAVAMAGNAGFSEAPVWSTGGLLALASAAWIHWRGRTWPSFRSRIWLPVLLGLLGPFIAVGLMNGYEHQVIDQPAREATTSVEYTGKYMLIDSDGELCEDGGDFYGCATAHTAMYNSLCTNSSLTDSAALKCSNLGHLVDQMWEDYEACGPGCIVAVDSSGGWWWNYQTIALEQAEVQNRDGRLPIAHKERCYFDLRVIQIGSCLPR